MKSACLAGALVFVSSCLAIAQVANLQIKIMEGDAATHIPGSRSAQPLTVEIADGAGHAVSGAAVSFRLPDSGPGGVFANGLRTEIAISDANGRASVRHLQFNDTPGDFQIRIMAAKEDARAGALVPQSILAGSHISGHSLMPKHKSGKKWVVLGVLVAGVAGGMGAGVMARPSTHPSAPAPAPAPVTIGPPTISVGK
jgi:hypothetical protein